MRVACGIRGGRRASKPVAQSRCAALWQRTDFLNSAKTLAFYGFFTFEKHAQPHEQRLGQRFCYWQCTIYAADACGLAALHSKQAGYRRAFSLDWKNGAGKTNLVL